MVSGSCDLVDNEKHDPMGIFKGRKLQHSLHLVRLLFSVKYFYRQAYEHDPSSFGIKVEKLLLFCSFIH